MQDAQPSWESRPLLQVLAAISRAIEARDAYTADHHRRVANLARRIAHALSLPAGRIEGIRLATTLHDVGKIGVPSELLTKPTKLNSHEIGLIRTHPDIGYGIFDGVQLPWPISETVLQHHERLDGSGYPRGLRGDEILLEARIVAVADVFDAMTWPRPYRFSAGLDAAMDELRANRDSLYDAKAVDACLAVAAASPDARGPAP